MTFQTTENIIIYLNSFIFQDVLLKFEMGWCFWSVLIAGSLCFIVGASISIIDLIYPHRYDIQHHVFRKVFLSLTYIDNFPFADFKLQYYLK